MISRKATLVLGILLILFFGPKARAEFNCADPVPTRSGLVKGAAEKESGACVWKGIPFAAPPKGDLRWKAPQPVPAWPGVREVSQFGPRCMQKGIFTLEVMASEEGMSEDCLYLNVWRPNKAGKFPVMVWIHGGGYTGGAASTPMYWGDRLAEQGDVVVVTTNYRLNIFGFFADPELRKEDPNRSTGGYATLDQVAALKWVNDNIGNFGGDPGKVTIFGESAGGWSICTLVATPLARGLFQRAILESGGCEQSEDLEKGYQISKKTAENFGCAAGDLKCLRAVPAKKLLKGSTGMTQGGGNMPHHDGYVLVGTPLSMIRAGNYNQAPFMAGSNRDEFGKAMKLRKDLKKIQPSDYESALTREFQVPEPEAKNLAALYPLSEFENRPVEAYGRMFGVDAALACPTYQGLLSAAGHQNNTYYYRFDYDRMALAKYTGSAHSFEIPFIFDAFDRLPMNLLYTHKNTPPAKALGKIIQGYWVNFAKTGNPNGMGLPLWPAFEPGNQKVQILDSEVHIEPASIAPRCGFWDEYSKHHKLEMRRAK